MKYLLSVLILLATTFSTMPAVAASPQEVLAQGEPPLTREAVAAVGSFFEWVFAARLTPAQQGELERILIAAWRRNDRGDIDGVKQIVELNAKASALTSEQREAVRGELRPKMIEALRAEQSNEFARLMLSLHDGGTTNPAVESQVAATSGATAGGDASALIGAWRSTEVSALQYQNRVTGSTTPGRGTSMAYRFYPDGRYEYQGYLQTTMYNCTTTVYNPITGSYRVEGSRIVLTPRTNLWQMRSPCYPSQNKDRQGKMEPEVLTWHTKHENNRENLCLTSSTGNEICYRKE